MYSCGAILYILFTCKLVNESGFTCPVSESFCGLGLAGYEYYMHVAMCGPKQQTFLAGRSNQGRQ